MKTKTLVKTKIKGVEFIGSSIMFIHLNNDRTFIVPLNKFPKIESLSQKEKKDFEIIDKGFYKLDFLRRTIF